MIPQRNKHDWNALYLEWVQSGVSLSQFQLRKGITRNHFYRVAQAGKWLQRKAELDAKAVQKVERSVVFETASQWREQEKLWRAVEIQAAGILKRTLTPEGKLLDPLSPTELSTLTMALERALKARKLLAGEATDNIATNVTSAGGSVHADVVAMVNERRKKAAIDVKPEPEAEPDAD
jgi:hypothetical protein